MSARSRGGDRRTTHVRIALYLGPDEHKLGTGKIRLLEAIRAHGSISAAAREMGMAYRHAWELVDDLNRCFAEPVVAAATGGRRGGGAQLTAWGEDLIRRFRRIETTTARALRAEIAALEKKCAGRTPRARSGSPA